MLNLLNKPKLLVCSASGIVYDNEVVVQKQVKNSTDILLIKLCFCVIRKETFLTLKIALQ